MRLPVISSPPGVITQAAAILGNGPPVSGIAGTGAGTTAFQGIPYVDLTNQIQYANFGSFASPLWIPAMMGDAV